MCIKEKQTIINYNAVTQTLYKDVVYIQLYISIHTIYKYMYNIRDIIYPKTKLSFKERFIFLEILYLSK